MIEDDPAETREWTDALDSVLRTTADPERAMFYSQLSGTRGS
jgi:pyruvate dehydrogenase complex dehydrogenase (E1) component